ncbi:MAG: EFR1 family ferrodoxin [Lachnospiraceae bacterium]|nr:EFR1 family ferrodoxin [Lachnospiraceae bacterium]
MIIYFSGTGNSKYIADRLDDILDEDFIHLNYRIKNSIKHRVEDDQYVFVVPTYAWRIPKLVTKWIQETELTENAKAWFVMNCGDGIGNADHYNQKLCRQKGLQYMGTAKIRMPENYIAMFNAPNPEQAQRIIDAANPIIDEAGRMILEGEPFPAPEKKLFSDWFLSAIINPFFYRFCVKAKDFRVGEACNGCGLCVRLCPLNNIHIQEGKPEWEKDCTHCMACICHCPEETIEYGKISVGKPRYHIDL